MPEFQPYLDSIDRHYSQRCKYYTLMDAEGQQNQESVPLFDFGLEVQTIVPKDELELGDRSQPKNERFPVTEGLQKYAIDHVLLVGRSGSGKSTALARLMFDLVKGSQIPVLVELRSIVFPM
jgi:predicted NACHT family NTPase